LHEQQRFDSTCAFSLFLIALFLHSLEQYLPKALPFSIIEYPQCSQTFSAIRARRRMLLMQAGEHAKYFTLRREPSRFLVGSYNFPQHAHLAS
jgi:hypothetical protein